MIPLSKFLYNKALWQGFLITLLVGLVIGFCVMVGHFAYTARVVEGWERDRLSLSGLLFMRGNYYFGDRPEKYNIEIAEQMYELALRFANPYLEPIHYQLGRVYFIKGELEQAVTQFNLQLEQNPEFQRTYYMRGLTYGYLNEFALAEQDFKQVLKWRPDSWAAHNDLVWVYFRAGSYDEAEQYARAGLLYSPGNAWLSNALGAILVNQGRYQEAEAHLLTAKEGFAAMGPEGWGIAYPGNDPRVYAEGQQASVAAAEANLQIIESALKE